MRQVKAVVLSFANPDLKAALELLDQAKVIHAGAMASENLNVKVGAQMREIVAKLNLLSKSYRRDEVIGQVKSLQRDIALRMSGAS
jgi:hypothetical protein